jgi:hypothetical protein
MGDFLANQHEYLNQFIQLEYLAQLNALCVSPRWKNNLFADLDK